MAYLKAFLAGVIGTALTLILIWLIDEFIL